MISTEVGLRLTSGFMKKLLTPKGPLFVMEVKRVKLRLLDNTYGP